jgi:Rrf2 family iron-sulfur cluster assembly transcriptional regulator
MDETRISDIILAVDEPIRATRCAPGSPSGCRANKSRCLTHDLWEELGNQIHLYLSAVTIAHVVQRRILGTSHLIDGPDAQIIAAPGMATPSATAAE